jgi:hypothetical protein
MHFAKTPSIKASAALILVFQWSLPGLENALHLMLATLVKG